MKKSQRTLPEIKSHDQVSCCVQTALSVKVWTWEGAEGQKCASFNLGFPLSFFSHQMHGFLLRVFSLDSCRAGMNLNQTYLSSWHCYFIHGSLYISLLLV